jgi:hypothetical protein
LGEKSILFFWPKKQYVYFLLVQEIDERKTPPGLLASHYVRSFVQKNSYASSACQTAFVFEWDLLSSLQAKRAKVVWGKIRKRGEI